MVDAARWEDGLKACENAMSVLPSATHLPLSKWKVSLNTEKAIVMTSVFDSVIPFQLAQWVSDASPAWAKRMTNYSTVASTILPGLNLYHANIGCTACCWDF